MTDLAGHFLLFTVIGIGFLLAPLILGWFVRPNLPSPEKVAAYECGEPAIGSSYIQFDLRFYVVALLFIIFDVEVAFFFPWATVYGGATQLMDQRVAAQAPARIQASEKLLNVPAGSLTADGVVQPDTAFKLAWTGLIDIAVFFGVLLVGFAYVWKRGDLDWVRAVRQEVSAGGSRGPPITPQPRKFESVSSPPHSVV